ncbi:hypothetical protein pkur_cds_629 [Pandoravirus kuranda]|uniref:Uncharacterized protein n=1 Tax=Pandoravirus kuranda TaxID=3019033 RepID=A0AA95J4K3_9VIRU|nr:hypothetical protein pkur_cds_629 [Pandoravirus kuranda]
MDGGDHGPSAKPLAVVPERQSEHRDDDGARGITDDTAVTGARVTDVGQALSADVILSATTNMNDIIDNANDIDNVNDMLPDEMLWLIFMFVGKGRMPCVPLMVCRRWRAVGGHCGVHTLLPVEIVDWLPEHLDVASLVARTAALMCLVGHPPRHPGASNSSGARGDINDNNNNDTLTALDCVCAALGAAGRWKHVITLVERAPRALDSCQHWRRVASGVIAPLCADDALGRVCVTGMRLPVLCTGLCCALAAGHAAATAALCARLANCGRARDSRYTARVDAATTTAARRGHVDAVLAQDFCTAHNVALLWDAVVGARDYSAFAKLVRAVRRVGPEAMNAARHASWNSRRTGGAGHANLGALALGWCGGGWARAAAASGWDVPFDMAMQGIDVKKTNNGNCDGGGHRVRTNNDCTGPAGNGDNGSMTTVVKNDMALAAHHPFRRSLSSLWTEAAAVAVRHGHHALAARLDAAATAEMPAA